MKFEKVSHEKLVLMLQHVSSQVAGLCGVPLVAVSMGEAAKPFLVEEQVVMSFCVAGVALRDASTCFLTDQ